MKSKFAEEKRFPKAAIVTTLKNAGPMLDSFITYHLSIGFEHIFLFFDDPDDPSIPVVQIYSNVTVVRHNDELRESWKQTKSYQTGEHIRRYLDEEVTARQVLNVEIAIDLAKKKGIDWLLHIDIDELFHSPSQSVGEHFQSLTDRGIHRVLYVNHEAIPETSEVYDPFKEATLFKKNPLTIDTRLTSGELKALVSRIPQLPERFFLCYRIGKSAARVADGLIPGVHEFRFIDETKWLPQAHRKFNNSRIGRSLPKKIPLIMKLVDRILASTERIKAETSKDPSILHYPACGFEAFWRKYVTLGSFADTWFGERDVKAEIGSFTLDARDIVIRNDREAAKQFYEERVVISDRAAIDSLIAGGLCCRILEPSRLLAREAAKGLITLANLETRSRLGSESFPTRISAGKRNAA